MLHAGNHSKQPGSATPNNPKHIMVRTTILVSMTRGASRPLIPYWRMRLSLSERALKPWSYCATFIRSVSCWLPFPRRRSPSARSSLPGWRITMKSRVASINFCRGKSVPYGWKTLQAHIASRRVCQSFECRHTPSSRSCSSAVSAHTPALRSFSNL